MWKRGRSDSLAKGKEKVVCYSETSRSGGRLVVIKSQSLVPIVLPQRPTSTETSVAVPLVQSMVRLLSLADWSAGI